MEQFELSISPVFNEVIRLAQDLSTVPSDESMQQEFVQSIANMAEFIESLSNAFNAAMQVRPKTPLSQQFPQEFTKDLEIITKVLKELKVAASEQNTGSFSGLLSRGREALAHMFDIFERMRKEEESFPVFSKSPYIQEIVRIATGVAKNQYKPETLKDKLFWLRDRYREFKEDFAGMRDIPAENEDVEKLFPIADQALISMGQALDEMAGFFKNYNKQLLKDGCAKLLQSSEILIAVQDRLTKASTAQPAACPKCGAMNPGGTKRCRSCSAQMPAIVGLSTQTMEYKEQTEGSNNYQYTHLMRITEACNSYKSKLIGDSELKREIDFFSGKVKKGLSDFKAMKDKADSSDETMEPQVTSMYENMEEGLNALVQGLDKLSKFLTSKDDELMESGLELLNRGADLMIRAQYPV